MDSSPAVPGDATPAHAWAFHADGSVFDLSAPAPESVCFIEIGQTLAGMRRFNGRGISVAQHSVMGAQAILNEGGTQMEASLFLLHDAHEWALGDFIRPAEKAMAAVITSMDGRKAASAFLNALAHLKSAWDLAIYRAASLPAPDRWSSRQRRVVKEMDDRMCRQEAIDRFGLRAAQQFPNSIRPKTSGDLRLWGQATAEEKFAEMAHRLIGSEQIAQQAALARATRQKALSR